MAITLLSGGLDSVVSTALARKHHHINLALTFDYGQRAAQQEIAAAKYFAALWNIPHQVIELPWLAATTRTSLVNQDQALPEYSQADLDNSAKQDQSAAAVWVPNRNGLMINIAAVYADASVVAKHIVTGFNREEAATFPDNSQDFIDQTNIALGFSTRNNAQVVSYTIAMDKAAIVATGRELGIDLDKCWSCYTAGPARCGQCESCVRFARAIR